MNALTVKKLRVRARSEDSSRAAFMIEDALRTEVASSDRLVLMRKLRLDQRASSSVSHVRTHSVHSAYSDQVASACHAASSGAANANCVWFANAAEAQSLLFERLLKGLTVEAWFWYLAVPEWNGRTLETWIEGRLARIFTEDNSATLLELINDFSRFDALDRLAEIVTHSAQLPTNFAAPIESSTNLLQPQQKKRENTDQPEDKLTVFSARRLIQSFPDSGRKMLAMVSRAGVSARPVLLRFCEQMALAVSPALGLNRARLACISDAMLEIFLSPEALPAECDDGSTLPTPKDSNAPTGTVPASPSERQTERARKSEDSKTKTKPEPSRAGGVGRREVLPDAAAKIEDSRLNGSSFQSLTAGLWLIIPTMIRCGWREWLQDNPDLLAHDPGRFLLRNIARHHRVKGTDHALLPLGEEKEIQEEPDWAFLWRRGIDGWLYHNTRIRLHRLIGRPGKIKIENARVDISFPIADADMRLRRRALDADPGWTDWLGLSVRYHFDGKASS